MSLNEQEEILMKATGQMVKSLNDFGKEETLNLLVRFSSQDSVLSELLATFPSIVALNYFLRGKPIIKVRMTEQALERLLDTKFPFLVREDESEEAHTVRRKVPRESKKTRCRKCKTRPGRQTCPRR